MKIVCIGGSGNISTSVVRLALSRGHQVTILNRSGDAALEALGARHIPCDVRSGSALEAVLIVNLDASLFTEVFNSISTNKQAYLAMNHQGILAAWSQNGLPYIQAGNDIFNILRFVILRIIYFIKAMRYIF